MTARGRSREPAGRLSRIYVPDVQSSDVYVIDPEQFRVVDDVQYAIDTRQTKSIRMGIEPYGAAVWLRSDRYFLGHAGKVRWNWALR